MYQVAILLNNTDANVSLSFKTEEAAKSANNTLNHIMREGSKNVWEMADDFGYILNIRPQDIAYTLFIDLEMAQSCQYEKNLAIARAGKKLAERCNTNPEERNLILNGQNAPASNIIQ